MEEIKELISVVLAHTKRNLPLVDLKSQSANGNKELNLFLGLKNGDYNSDTEASLSIYGSEEVDFKFRMLKSRLNRKLLNHLFFVDSADANMPKGASPLQECFDFLYFARTLLKIGQIKMATRLLTKVIEIAKVHEFTEPLLMALRELRTVYAQTYHPKLFRNINEDIAQYAALQAKEEQAAIIYDEIQLLFHAGINNRKLEVETVVAGLEELRRLNEETKTYNIAEKYIQLHLRHLELEGKYEEALSFIDNTCAQYDLGKVNFYRFDPKLLYTAKLHALWKSEQLQEAMVYAQKMLEAFQPNTNAWRTFMEKYMLVAIHDRQYHIALQLFLDLADNKWVQSQEDAFLTKLNIYRAYLFFITARKELIKRFDFDNFLNSMPEYEKENAGANVAVLILQAVHKLDHEPDVLERHVLALDEYVVKYLNNCFGKRTKLMVKLLNKIASHDMDPETVAAKSRYLEERLLESVPSSDEFIDMEIVPYKHLWEIVMKDLRIMKRTKI